MAYTFRAAATTTPGTTTNATGITCNKPSGTVDGDLMVALCYLESDTNSWATAPAGWNTDTTNLKIANTGSFFLQIFWKIASSEGASFTFKPTSTGWAAVTIASYSGATGAGSTRVDVRGVNQGDAQPASTQTAPSVTTTVNSDLVVWGYGNFNGDTVLTTTGFCTNVRADSGGACIADANQATAGATGTTRPATGNAAGTQTFAAIHVAFFLDSGGGGVSIAMPLGSVSYAGLAPTGSAGLMPSMGAGEISVAGQAPAVRVVASNQILIRPV